MYTDSVGLSAVVGSGDAGCALGTAAAGVDDVGCAAGTAAVDVGDVGCAEDTAAVGDWRLGGGGGGGYAVSIRSDMAFEAWGWNFRLGVMRLNRESWFKLEVLRF